LARLEGIGVEPASAASLAGLRKLIAQGTIDRDEVVVCVTTGHLLKDPEAIMKACHPPIEVDANFDALYSTLSSLNNLE
jgi:threonine synthase